MGIVFITSNRDSLFMPFDNEHGCIF